LSSDFAPVTIILRKAKMGGLGITNVHDHSGELLRIGLGIASMQCDRLQTQTVIKIGRGNNVLQGRNDALNIGDMMMMFQR